jgi:hypothetical protein
MPRTGNWPPFSAAGKPSPDEDRPLVAAAITLDCNLFWTGDNRHFGSLYGKTIHGVTFLSGVMLAKAHLD